MKTLLAAAATTLVLAGCSTGPDHNDADIAFAQGMIPHHQQAIDMSNTAATRGGPQVKALARQIKAAQGPEIRTMTGWLKDWNARSMEHGDGHGVSGDMKGDMGGGHMGMLDEKTMSKLDAAKGAAFDRLWLRGMIQHHQGAIDMAKTEIASGEYPKAVTMAKSIVTSQQAEIDHMREMLK